MANSSGGDTARSLLKVDPVKLGQLESRFPEVPDEARRRFLIGRQGNLEKAAAMLEAHLTWKSELPSEGQPREAVQRCLDAAFFRGVQLPGGGVNVLLDGGRLGRLAECRSGSWRGEYDVEAVMEAITRTSEKILPDGYVGRANVLLTIGGGSVLHWALIRTFVSVMQANYPERLNRAYIYPSTTLAWSLWSVAKWFLAPETRARVVLVEEPYESWLEQGFSHEELAMVLPEWVLQKRKNDAS